MAFVSKQPRRIFSVKPSATQSESIPKASDHSSPKKSQIPAPFNSSVMRSKQKPVQQPGPGSYNLTSDLAKHKVLEESFDSLVRILESPTPTNTFKSGSKRFKSDDNKVPGPGSYADYRPQHHHHNPTPFRCASTKILDFLRRQRKPKIGNILGLNASLKELEVPVHEKPKEKKTQGPSAFFKSRVQRSIIERPKTTLGPGSYNINKTCTNSTAPTAPNSSQTKRRPIKSSSSLNRCKLTSQSQKPPSKNDDLMNINVGPGYYYDEKLFSSFKVAKPTQNQFFGSTVQRFYASKNPNLGPGSYNIDKTIQSEKIDPSSFFKSKQQRFCVKLDMKGPGCYYPSNTVKNRLKQFVDLLEELKKKGPEDRVGGKANRFKHIRTDTPGPGYYYSEKSTQKTRQKSAVFMQSRQRQPQYECPPPGAYDLTSHTIAKRIIAKKNDQNTHNPPFLSCERRFKEPTDEDYIYTATQCQRHDHDSPKRPTTSSVPFRSSEERFGDTRHANLPGPANYNVPSNLNKQSFNIMFCR